MAYPIVLMQVTVNFIKTCGIFFWDSVTIIIGDIQYILLTFVLLLNWLQELFCWRLRVECCASALTFLIRPAVLQ
jgi:hypothetical protein